MHVNRRDLEEPATMDELNRHIDIVRSKGKKENRKIYVVLIVRDVNRSCVIKGLGQDPIAEDKEIPPELYRDHISKLQQNKSKKRPYNILKDPKKVDICCQLYNLSNETNKRDRLPHMTPLLKALYELFDKEKDGLSYKNADWRFTREIFQKEFLHFSQQEWIEMEENAQTA
jgi:hypothetical protein